MGRCLGRFYGSTTPIPIEKAAAAWDEEFALTGARLGLKTADAIHWIVPSIAAWGRTPADPDVVPARNRWDEALAAWSLAGENLPDGPRIHTEGEMS